MVLRSLAIVVALCVCGTSANALTMKECSVKYKAAQTAGTLKGQKWNDFRKAECGADAEATPAATPTTAPVAPAAPKTSSAPAQPRPTAAKPAPASPASGSATFPSSVSSKYSNEPAGKARMHTCRDQYNANKATNGNGGMKWTEKGGGYYSECNKQLKG
jgi:hypothetical protein